MTLTYTVSFDLADAQAYIPQGRINNLKKNLHWDQYVLTDEQIKNAISHNLYQKFQVGLDYEKKALHSCQEYMASKDLEAKRLAIYNNLGRDQINRKELFGEQIHLLTEEMREEIPSIFEELKLEPEVEKRMNKLKQLKMLNRENDSPNSKMTM